MNPYRCGQTHPLETYTLSRTMRPWTAFLLGWLLLSAGCASGWNAPIAPSTANALNGCPVGSVASRGACRYLDWGPTEHSSTDAAEEAGHYAQ